MGCNAVRLGTDVPPNHSYFFSKLLGFKTGNAMSFTATAMRNLTLKYQKLHGEHYCAMMVTEEKDFLGRDYWIEKILWLA